MDNGERGDYCVVTDDDGHYYVIPATKLSEWWEWCESEDAEDGVVPDWAIYVNGPVSSVRFNSWTRG